MKSTLEESELLKKLASLPREIAPRQEVWPRISARLAEDVATRTPESWSFRSWPLAAAASFLVIVAAGLLWSVQLQQPEIMPPGVAMENRPGASYYSGAPSTGELEYRAALREFMALNAASAASDQSAQKWIEQGWQTLHQIELEVTAAIRKEPDNDFLKSRLALLRGRQIELLRQIAATDNISWRNNI